MVLLLVVRMVVLRLVLAAEVLVVVMLLMLMLWLLMMLVVVVVMLLCVKHGVTQFCFWHPILYGKDIQRPRKGCVGTQAECRVERHLDAWFQLVFARYRAVQTSATCFSNPKENNGQPILVL